ncbi:phosphatidylinositol 4-phosphate 5-kinase 2-like [Asparagus officinalis]|uniref:phosphatidylinositol 4-phosphate 5-kinase 2-like n=1 Tax=Asparagus officinalis TaxID=4686 RepID=UPI00098E3FE0|nr:phosphatidylinositol 4-phosphate 5-kinase 2-like [Asparagus officinalis]
MEAYADEVGAPNSRETVDLDERVSRLVILWTKKRSGSPSQAPDSSVSTSSAAVAAVSGDGGGGISEAFEMKLIIQTCKGCPYNSFDDWGKCPWPKYISVLGETQKNCALLEFAISLVYADKKVYNNGDVYEGEFHKRKCSGSGVYYYYMSGRYEGDWVDDKYDGYRVETWARGSRYRGQYRQGLRHGFGVYRFYTGDVYSGGWSNGQNYGMKDARLMF